MKITQADTSTIWMDCHHILIVPNLCHSDHFYARCPSWHNPPNFSWLGTGTKFADKQTDKMGQNIISTDIRQWWQVREAGITCLTVSWKPQQHQPTQD